MAVKTIDEFMSMIRNRVGDSTSDEDIAFIEDANDTLKSFENSQSEIERLKSDNEDLRKRYKERFFSASSAIDDKNESDEETKMTTFDDLFKED